MEQFKSFRFGNNREWLLQHKNCNKKHIIPDDTGYLMVQCLDCGIICIYDEVVKNEIKGLV